MSLILAYHGCELETAQKLLGGLSFQPSTRDYDWLGTGVYFWENDVRRAYQWACEPRRKFSHPSVVGAAIELGHCLDLTTQAGIEAVKIAHAQFTAMLQQQGLPVPANEDPARETSGDLVIRRLDCAVINHLFQIVQEEQPMAVGTRTYDTVRALFPEGGRLYPGAGFLAKTHIQINVLTPESILGVFRVPDWQMAELGLDGLYR